MRLSKILLFCSCFLAVVSAQAALGVSTASDGTVTLTLNASGDLNSGYAGLSSDVTGATTLIVVTADGVSMSSEDAKRLMGDYGVDYFPNVTTLDMSAAVLASDADLWRLKLMNNLKSFTFPAATTVIPAACLSSGENTVIEEIVIPDNTARSVTIGQQAFMNCLNLKKLVLGAVASGTLGTSFCAGNTALATVEMHAGWTTVGQQAFENCSALTSLVLAEGIETIEVGAFSGAGLQAIRLPNTLKTIKQLAFRCHALKSITIPASVELIQSQTFQECYALTDIYVLGTTTKCENQAFQATQTYNYEYYGAGTGEQVTKEDYTKNASYAYTVLHYPEAAYATYVNEFTRALASGSLASFKAYGYNEWEYKYVTSDGGEIWSTGTNGASQYYDQPRNAGDYKGWNNFMFVAKLTTEDVWEDTKRVNDKWYSICVPFNMTAAQLQAAYGANVEVVEFSGVEVSTGANNKKSLLLQFKTPVSEIKAHHPYMIHPDVQAGTAGVKVTIAGIEKEAEDESSLEAAQTTYVVEGVTYTFKGSYDAAKQLQPYSYYYYSGDDVSVYPNGFYKWGAVEGGKWTPYTACVLLDKDNGASAASIAFATDTEHGAVTGLATIYEKDAPESADSDAPVYDLGGRKIASGAAGARLPKGVYIISGRKIIVK